VGTGTRTAVVHDGEVLKEEEVLVERHAGPPHARPGVVLQHRRRLLQVLDAQPECGWVGASGW
jgi:hypothetical protein